MSLTLAMNNALSGLKINQESLGVLSQNIANVNTEGYSRQVISQSSITVAGVGSGVQIDEISRKIDKYLQRSMQTQSSNNATAQTLNDYYQRLQAVLGKPGASNSIDTSITSFFNSVQQLAVTPETSSLKANAVASAEALADQLSHLAGNVQDLRYEADRAMDDAVKAINSSLLRLQDINKTLVVAKQLSQSTAGLLDARDKEISNLSSYMDLSVSFNDSGSASIIAGDGAVLLEDGIRHQLTYIKSASVNNFVTDVDMNPMLDVTLDSKGNQVGSPITLISGGPSEQVISKLSSGSLAGLQQLRDVQLPAVLKQLDQLAAKLRDTVNTIHNQGSSFPPAATLTGDRVIYPGDSSEWSGQVRIAVLQSDGLPVPSLYADETYTGLRPLTLDLSRLNSGNGAGRPTMQAIIDEINDHFAAPTTKAKLGNLNNIRLASDTTNMPSGSPPLFNFDLDVENISSDYAKVFVTGVTVKDDTATDITNVTQTALA